MLLTSSPKLTLPRHSTGWRVMRLVTDRGGKNTLEGPAVWGRHRILTGHEAQAAIRYRIRTVQALTRSREIRP